MPNIRIPWKLQQLAKFLLGEDWVYNRATFRPDFTERAFMRLASVPQGLGAHKQPPGHFQREIVEQFLQRKGVEFLMPFEKVMALAGEMTVNHPVWRDNILAAASETCDEGLLVYHLRRSPLNASFPWKMLKKGPYNDQLFLSRPQRFGFAPVLAQASLFDSKYISRLDDILRGWQSYAQTSRFRWPYNSNHAVVYRVLALCFCWTFIGAIHRQESRPESTSVLFRILNILRNDILFLGSRLGNAKPNNHLLADYFVGWLIDAIFPQLIPGSMDFSVYEEKWQRELLRQFYPDGGCFEHAVHYQEHGCEMAAIYRLIAGGSSIPQEIDQRIARMLEFQAVLNGTYCRPWAMGDTTEDTLLPLDATLGWSAGAMLALNNFLYPGQAIPSSAEQPDQKAFWLLAGECAPVLGTGPRAVVMKEYPDSGVVRWLDRDSDSELVFRTGVAPGRNFIPGHMHADALSLFWRVNGTDVLAASGTYTYKYSRSNGESERAYFCGPWSHSCVVIDGEDPLGPMRGDFRGLDNGLRVVSRTNGDATIASLSIGEVQSSNCYHGFRRGVLHVPQEFTMVFDILTKQQIDMRVGAGWQFGKDVAVDDNGRLEITKKGVRLGVLTFPSEGNLQTYHGHDSPMRGWQSDSYGVKAAAVYAHIGYPKGTRIFAHLILPETETGDYAIESTSFHEEFALIKMGAEREASLVYLSLGDMRYDFNIEELAISARAVVHTKRFDDVETLVVVDCDSLIGLAEGKSVECALALRMIRLKGSENWEIVK